MSQGPYAVVVQFHSPSALRDVTPEELHAAFLGFVNRGDRALGELLHIPHLGQRPFTLHPLGNPAVTDKLTLRVSVLAPELFFRFWERWKGRGGHPPQARPPLPGTHLPFRRRPMGRAAFLERALRGHARQGGGALVRHPHGIQGRRPRSSPPPAPARFRGLAPQVERVLALPPRDIPPRARAQGGLGRSAYPHQGLLRWPLPYRRVRGAGAVPGAAGLFPRTSTGGQRPGAVLVLRRCGPQDHPWHGPGVPPGQRKGHTGGVKRWA